jgi:hypothetical protein
MFLLPLLAQQKPANLRILDPQISNDELIPLMQSYAEALDVDCTFCHAPHSFASDDTPRKAGARNMMILVNELNAKFPAGKTRITCYTCHRSERIPKTEPSAKK